jgi:hypothetical protein
MHAGAWPPTGNLQPTISSMHAHPLMVPSGGYQILPGGMCSNSNVWLETRTQASPAIRGHARTSNHHPSQKYLNTTIGCKRLNPVINKRVKVIEHIVD